MFKTKLVFGYYSDHYYFDGDYDYDEEADDYFYKLDDATTKRLAELKARSWENMCAFLKKMESLYEKVEVVVEPRPDDEHMNVTLNVYSSEFVPFRVFLERHWGPRSYNVERSDDPPLRDLYQ